MGAVASAARAAGGQSAVALRAWHEAVRLGDTRAVDPLSRLCAEVACAVGGLALAHARALAAGDEAALRAVSDELAAAGMRAAATDAAAQARRIVRQP
ncbi:aminotransferase [Mycobacterium sp. E796]|nr:aminotransferase [Mycobacterium sp. E796]